MSTAEASEDQVKEMARAMFNAYNDAGPNPWKTFDGRAVPEWHATSEQVRAKWFAAATYAFSYVRGNFPEQS